MYLRAVECVIRKHFFVTAEYSSAFGIADRIFLRVFPIKNHFLYPVGV